MTGRMEFTFISPVGFVGIVEVLAALLMLWSLLRITTPAGWHSTQARWALFRRFVYGMMTIALFGLGIGRLDGRYAVDSDEQLMFQMMLLFGIVVFPLLRAFGFISQDALLIDPLKK